MIDEGEVMMIDLCWQEENEDQQTPTTEKEVEKDEEEEEEEEEEDDNADVQSFVTAHESENDHVTESLNGLYLGHDDDGKILNFHLFISAIF